MDATAVYYKTPKGEEEIKTRAAKLPQKLRTMLIMIDGTKTAGDLGEIAKRLSISEDFIAALEGQGLVARAGAGTGGSPSPAAATPAGSDEVARFVAAQRFMNDTVVDALGIRSFFFSMKIEKCASRAELAQLLDEYAQAITKAAGPEQASVVVERARELLR